ncbi:MAG TPA: hypothetical protein VFU01_06610 [Gemmatimonadaceae bacterium]|nr:hypothetical protein [Gemmatimonadaceae bacterium]
MAIVRRVAPALALVAIASQAGFAQLPRDDFRDSWFWGAKGGVISFSTATVDNKVKPLVGGEWLLTRTQGALYLAVDQAMFDETSSLMDTAETSHTVTIRDLRRLTAAAMAFPWVLDAEIATFRPYAGVGFALNFLRTAELTAGLPSDTAARKDLRRRLEDQQDRAAPLLILGLQAQVGKIAAFIQGTAMPAETRFLLNGSPTFFAEVGLRVNAGRSREIR